MSATAALIAEPRARRGAGGRRPPEPDRGRGGHDGGQLDKSWIGVNAVEAFSEAVGRPVVVLNDADAAGLAEVRFGAGKGVPAWC